MLWNLKESTVVIGDHRMDYAVFGMGKTPFVILPGLSLRDVKGAGAGLAMMYRMFARDYRVYVFDKPADIEGDTTVAALAEATARAMAALGIENACMLGVSLGGMIAQEIAIRHPEMVLRLVLGVSASRINPTMEQVVERWIALAQNRNYGGIVTDLLTVMYSEAYARKYRLLFPILAKFARPKNEARFLHLAKACLTCDSYSRLDRIACPTLILGGSEDKIVTGQASIEMAQAMGCPIHLYEGLGHAAYEEAPDFNKRILQFFKAEAAALGTSRPSHRKELT